MFVRRVFFCYASPAKDGQRWLGFSGFEAVGPEETAAQHGRIVFLDYEPTSEEE